VIAASVIHTAVKHSTRAPTRWHGMPISVGLKPA
jgi:hypothetical protein